jgi:hypothetical protein
VFGILCLLSAVVAGAVLVYKRRKEGKFESDFDQEPPRRSEALMAETEEFGEDPNLALKNSFADEEEK